MAMWSRSWICLATNGLTHIAIVADPRLKSDTTAKVISPNKLDVAAPATAAGNADAPSPAAPASGSVVPIIPVPAASAVAARPTSACFQPGSSRSPGRDDCCGSHPIPGVGRAPVVEPAATMISVCPADPGDF